MVQSGDDYREKNRLRLQRFYEKQKRQGKKRVSALVSDEAYQLLTDQKEQSGESMSTLIDQAVMVAYGDQDILDVDDVSADFLAAYSGPDPADTQETDTTDQADDAQDPEQDQANDTQEPDQGKDVEPDLEAAQVDTVTDDTALVDQELDTTAQGPDIIPDCTGKTITIEERDRILVQVMELMPGRSNAQVRVDTLNSKGVPVVIKPGNYGGTWDRKKVIDNLRLAKKRLGIK
jgi:hypothetical protein